MLYLDADEVAARLDRTALIDALEQAFRGQHRSPERQHYAVGGVPESKDALLIMPAWRDGDSMGVKLVTVFPGNGDGSRRLPAVHATYVLFDGRTGEPRAVLDGTELTRRRTAAASALAARYLARADAGRLLMVGTGALAPHIVASHARVRPIHTVRIWGRSIAHARALERRLADRTPEVGASRSPLHEARSTVPAFAVEAVDDLEAAVRWADIITCATLSETPLVQGAWLHPGQHIDLIGAFTPCMREADDATLSRAEIYVDTRAGALAESGELLHALAAGVITPASIRGELADLVRGHATGRRAADEITLFKSVGCAVADLAAAELAMQFAAP